MMDTPARRRSTRRLWFALGVVILGCLLGVGVFALGDLAIPTAGATPDGPTPPVTLVFATQPVSQVTPLPAASAGAEYLSAARAALTAWESSAAVLAQQGQLVQGNSSLLNDSAWRSNTSAAVTAMQQAANGFRGLPAAPAGYEPVAAAVTQLAAASDATTSDVNALLAGDFTAAFRLEGDFNQTTTAYQNVQQALQAAPAGG
jgi:hypothetical protein